MRRIGVLPLFLCIGFPFGTFSLRRSETRSLVRARCLLGACSMLGSACGFQLSLFASVAGLLGACSVPARCLLGVCLVPARCLLGACSVPARCLLGACPVLAWCLLGVCTQNDLRKKHTFYKCGHMSGPRASPDMILNAFNVTFHDNKKRNATRGL